MISSDQKMSVVAPGIVHGQLNLWGIIIKRSENVVHFSNKVNSQSDRSLFSFLTNIQLHD